MATPAAAKWSWRYYRLPWGVRVDVDPWIFAFGFEARIRDRILTVGIGFACVTITFGFAP